MRSTPLFETAFYKLCETYPAESLFEVLNYFEHVATRDPRRAGVPHPNLEQAWVFEFSGVQRLPRVVILYRIDDAAGLVIQANIHVL